MGRRSAKGDGMFRCRRGAGSRIAGIAILAVLFIGSSCGSASQETEAAVAGPASDLCHGKYLMSGLNEVVEQGNVGLVDIEDALDRKTSTLRDEVKTRGIELEPGAVLVDQFEQAAPDAVRHLAPIRTVAPPIAEPINAESRMEGFDEVWVDARALQDASDAGAEELYVVRWPIFGSPGLFAAEPPGQAALAFYVDSAGELVERTPCWDYQIDEADTAISTLERVASREGLSSAELFLEFIGKDAQADRQREISEVIAPRVDVGVFQPERVEPGPTPEPAEPMEATDPITVDGIERMGRKR